ncbi:MAG TPA: YcbK family protein [Candidatus Binataceae bacterium]|nr:YcbK family protein [Candidatus Binataceae bacterium]
MKEREKPATDSLVTRRGLLRSGAIVAVAMVVPGFARAGEWIRLPAESESSGPMRAGFLLRPRAQSMRPRALSVYNIHTGENLKTVYFENGAYVPEALREVNYFFRDFRANEVKPIDPHLLDLLHQIHAALDTGEPFTLISGYRSAATNAMLASHSEGVARHSMHIEGRASDINVPGRQLSLVQRAALMLRGGGVGYYPRSDFVHVDTGRVRRW